MTPIEMLESGELRGAIQGAMELVKKSPTNTEQRMLLCQLLCLAGDLERADKQLDLLLTQAPDAVLGLAEFRQLIRAEQARRDFYTDGRLPEFLGEPTPVQKLQLKASVALRENSPAEARELLELTFEQEPDCTGEFNGAAFAGFRDLDDLLGTTIEVLTSNGKYYWVPAARIRRLEFHPPELYHQLQWRRAEIDIEDGPQGVVHVPAIYCHPQLPGDEQAQLGRVTEWEAIPEGPTLGIGQKTWLIGEADVPVMSIETLSFTQI